MGERGMRESDFVVQSEGFAQHFCFQQSGEGFTVEELIEERAFEAFAVSVLPRTAEFDTEGLKRLLKIISRRAATKNQTVKTFSWRLARDLAGCAAYGQIPQ